MPDRKPPDDIYDEWLVVRCCQSDDAAWSELVGRYNERLTFFVRRLVDADAVSGVLQETWLGVFRGLRRLRSGERFAPWVYRIARNQAMNRLRRQYAEAVSQLETLDDVPDDSASADAFDNAELVHAALSQLSLPHREVLTLFFLRDLSIAEIASILGVAEGTVKSRLSRARSELTRVLKMEDNP